MRISHPAAKSEETMRSAHCLVAEAQAAPTTHEHADSGKVPLTQVLGEQWGSFHSTVRVLKPIPGHGYGGGTCWGLLHAQAPSPALGAPRGAHVLGAAPCSQAPAEDVAGGGSRPGLEELSCVGAALATTWAVPFCPWFSTHCGSWPGSTRWGAGTPLPPWCPPSSTGHPAQLHCRRERAVRARQGTTAITTLLLNRSAPNSSASSSGPSLSPSTAWCPRPAWSASRRRPCPGWSSTAPSRRFGPVRGSVRPRRSRWKPEAPARALLGSSARAEAAARPGTAARPGPGPDVSASLRSHPELPAAAEHLYLHPQRSRPRSRAGGAGSGRRRPLLAPRARVGQHRRETAEQFGNGRVGGREGRRCHRNTHAALAELSGVHTIKSSERRTAPLLLPNARGGAGRGGAGGRGARGKGRSRVSAHAR